MSIKEELLKLVKNSDCYHGGVSLKRISHNFDYYLWMCKLQKWLRDNKEIHVWVEQKSSFYFPRLGKYNKGDNVGKNYESALEEALIEAFIL